jgi:hypothetical protein
MRTVLLLIDRTGGGGMLMLGIAQTCETHPALAGCSRLCLHEPVIIDFFDEPPLFLYTCCIWLTFVTFPLRKGHG